MFGVGVRVGTSMVDDPVPVIGRRVERIEFQRDVACIDDVMLGSGRHDQREARPDRGPNPIENGFTTSLLDAKELVELWTSAPISSLGCTP